MSDKITNYFEHEFPKQLCLLPITKFNDLSIKYIWGENVLKTFDNDIKNVPCEDKELFVLSLFMITFVDQALHSFSRQLHKIWQEKTNFPKLGYIDFGINIFNPFLILYVAEQSDTINHNTMQELFPDFSAFMINKIVVYFKEIFSSKIDMKDFFTFILQDTGYQLIDTCNFPKEFNIENIQNSSIIKEFKHYFEAYSKPYHNKKYCLNYKEYNDKIYDDLLYAVKDMKKMDNFSAEKFYYNLDKIIRELSPNNSFGQIKNFPQKQPVYLFSVLFNCLKKMDKTNNLEEEFNYLKEFIDCEIDVFMIVNYLKEI